MAKAEGNDDSAPMPQFELFRKRNRRRTRVGVPPCEIPRTRSSLLSRARFDAKLPLSSLPLPGEGKREGNTYHHSIGGGGHGLFKKVRLLLSNPSLWGKNFRHFRDPQYWTETVTNKKMVKYSLEKNPSKFKKISKKDGAACGREGPLGCTCK